MPRHTFDLPVNVKASSAPEGDRRFKILVLHDHIDSVRIFDALVASLFRPLRTPSLDFRGHGDSEPANSYAIEDLPACFWRSLRESNPSFQIEKPYRSQQFQDPFPHFWAFQPAWNIKVLRSVRECRHKADSAALGSITLETTIDTLFLTHLGLGMHALWTALGVLTDIKHVPTKSAQLHSAECELSVTTVKIASVEP
jgi:hypothetical protein